MVTSVMMAYQWSWPRCTGPLLIRQLIWLLIVAREHCWVNVILSEFRLFPIFPGDFKMLVFTFTGFLTGYSTRMTMANVLICSNSLIYWAGQCATCSSFSSQLGIGDLASHVLHKKRGSQ